MQQNNGDEKGFPKCLIQISLNAQMHRKCRVNPQTLSWTITYVPLGSWWVFCSKNSEHPWFQNVMKAPNVSFTFGKIIFAESHILIIQYFKLIFPINLDRFLDLIKDQLTIYINLRFLCWVLLVISRTT